MPEKRSRFGLTGNEAPALLAVLKALRDGARRGRFVNIREARHLALGASHQLNPPKAQQICVLLENERVLLRGADGVRWFDDERAAILLAGGKLPKPTMSDAERIAQIQERFDGKDEKKSAEPPKVEKIEEPPTVPTPSYCLHLELAERDALDSLLLYAGGRSTFCIPSDLSPWSRWRGSDVPVSDEAYVGILQQILATPLLMEMVRHGPDLPSDLRVLPLERRELISVTAEELQLIAYLQSPQFAFHPETGTLKQRVRRCAEKYLPTQEAGEIVRKCLGQSPDGANWRLFVCDQVTGAWMRTIPGFGETRFCKVCEEESASPSLDSPYQIHIVDVTAPGTLQLFSPPQEPSNPPPKGWRDLRGSKYG